MGKKDEMELKIMDTGEPLNIETLPLAVIRMVEFLKQAKDGELYRARALSERLGYKENYLKGYSAHPNLLPYRVKVGMVAYFANEKTVQYVKETKGGK